jgi:hypothetical protein
MKRVPPATEYYTHPTQENGPWIAQSVQWLGSKMEGGRTFRFNAGTRNLELRNVQDNLQDP